MNKRIEFIDISKGIGILLVIIGHMNINQSLLQYIMSFHMPLFIILSGMTFNHHKIKHNISALLIPYFTMGFIMISLNSLMAVLTGNNTSNYIYIYINSSVF